MPNTVYEAVWIFIIYAFIGWCSEVSYAALNVGKFVNRGFLNGPCCPIYGFGMLIVVVVLTPLKNNLIILFIGSMLFTTILEYISGYILEKVFHNKWWDYSELPFNIQGYVCLKFSILWGLACSFIMRIIHPLVMVFLHILPQIFGRILLIILILAFIADCIFTIGTIINFNKRLRIMGEITEKLRMISDGIGENIYENVTDTIERSEKRKAEYKELNRRYKELLEKKIYSHDRLIKAFPKMKSKDYEESLLKLKEHLKQFVKKKKN